MAKNQIFEKSGIGSEKPKLTTKRSRLNKTLDVGSIVDTVIKTITNKKNSPLLKIEIAWNKCFEKEMIENCELNYFRNGILTIYTKSHLWQTELLFRHESIVKQLNQQLGEDFIKNIIVKIKSD